MWSRNITAPVYATVQEDACFYLLRSGMETVLKENCGGCSGGVEAPGPMEDYEHTCEWPTSTEGLEKVLTKVALSEEAFNLYVEKTVKVLNGKTTMSAPLSFGDAVTRATLRLLQEDELDGEMETLFRAVQTYTGKVKRNLFNVV